MTNMSKQINKKFKTPYPGIEEKEPKKFDLESLRNRRSKRVLDSTGERGADESDVKRKRDRSPSPPLLTATKATFSVSDKIRKELQKLQAAHRKLEKDTTVMEASMAEMKAQMSCQDAIIANQLRELEGLREAHTAHTKSLNCTICLDIMTLPHVVPGCGHTFCFACLRDWLRVKLECPTCRAVIALPHQQPSICLALRDQVVSSVETISDHQQRQEALKRLETAGAEYKVALKHDWLFLAFQPVNDNNGTIDQTSDSEDEDFVDIEIADGFAINVPNTPEGFARADALAAQQGFVAQCLECDTYARNADACGRCNSAVMRVLDIDTDGEGDDFSDSDSTDEASDTDSVDLINSTDSNGSNENDSNGEEEAPNHPYRPRVSPGNHAEHGEEENLENNEDEREGTSVIPPSRNRGLHMQNPPPVNPNRRLMAVNNRRTVNSLDFNWRRAASQPLRRGTITAAGARGRRR